MEMEEGEIGGAGGEREGECVMSKEYVCVAVAKMPLRKEK